MHDHTNDETLTSASRNDILVLFDVDGTITPSRQPIEDEVDKFIQSLKTRVTVGLVGGSDIKKISEQTLPTNLRSSGIDPVDTCINRFDYVFSENGLVAYKRGIPLPTKNIVEFLGEEKLQIFINSCLRYMSELQLPIKRGNFIELREGLINISPIGRSCSQKEREEFFEYDKKNKIRQKFIDYLKSEFGPDGESLDLVFSIGGQISFDVFPKGWDKTYCLNLIDDTHKKIYFFGDRTCPGGNDYEIYCDSRVLGHSVICPEDTLNQLRILDL